MQSCNEYDLEVTPIAVFFLPDTESIALLSDSGVIGQISPDTNEVQMCVGDLDLLSVGLWERLKEVFRIPFCLLIRTSYRFCRQIEFSFSCPKVGNL